MAIRILAKKEIKKPRKNLNEKNQETILILNSWLDGDEKEQKETFIYLKKVLDEDRLSDRKLF